MPAHKWCCRQKSRGNLGHQIADHHGNHGKSHCLGDKEKTDMGWCQANGGVYRNLAFSLVDGTDHGIQDDQNGDKQGDDDVGHSTVIHGIADVIEPDPIFFAGKNCQAEPVGQVGGDLANLVGIFWFDGDILQSASRGQKSFRRNNCRLARGNMLISALEDRRSSPDSSASISSSVISVPASSGKITGVSGSPSRSRVFSKISRLECADNSKWRAP